MEASRVIGTDKNYALFSSQEIPNPMTREQHLEFCRRCTNRKFDPQQGIICSLTNKIADFEGTCENYNLDESVKIEKAEEETTPNYQIVSNLDDSIKQQLRDQQDVVYALVGGLAAALVGAIIWAAITVATNYQIGYMAIAVGLLAGLSVRYFGAGVDQHFGIIGATFALAGCVLGNLFSQIVFIANNESLGYLETLSYLNLDLILSIYAESFSPIDILFYGIAAYEGYKFAFRSVSEEQLNNLKAGKIEPPPFARFRLPVVIGLFLMLSIGWFFLSKSTQGEMTFYYESGAKRSTGQVIGGLEEGPWRYWYENGNLFYEGFFKEGKLDSTWRYYDEEGNVTSEGSFTKNLKHGEWKEYYSSGQLSTISTYVLNRLQGPSTNYYQNGAMSMKGSYHLDRPHGNWEVYYENGNLNYKGAYDKDLQVGNWTWWTEEGTKLQEAEYKDGERLIINTWNANGQPEVITGNGTYHMYETDGTVSETGLVKNGKQVGIWKKYISGELYEEGEFRDGVYYINNAWSFGGKQVVKNGEGSYKNDAESGNFGTYEGLVKGGLKSGSWTLMSNDGNVLQESNYKQGKLNGPFATYFADGTVSARGEMKDDVREGKWIWYYENGNPESEATFSQGKKQGNQLFYTDDGVLLRTEVYNNGELVDVILP